MEKVYNAKQYEDDIYQKWEESGFFNPDNLDLPDDAPNYSIVFPPPNITDKLHLGHASTIAIEDLLIRYKRMNGFRVLWVPGTDHAAIATQNAVEKKILKEEKKTRHELGREEFLRRVEDFIQVTQKTILNQTRKMGASMDWSRTAFTLDDDRQKAVRTMFKLMYEEGAIYRGERVVNWCPRCHSTLADDEVEYKAQKAKFYTFKYDHDFPIAISTTRPETKLGDTAVAVNPKDERYKKYIGKDYEVNFCGVALQIKIIADRHVDMEFGTGALGVTPAHSMADSQMAEANDLDSVKVIDEDGKIHNGLGKLSGLSVKEARKIIVEELAKNKLIEKEEEIDNNLSICYRCDTPIEPLPSKQWFIAVDKKLNRLNNKSLKEAALEATKKIEFIPARFEKRYSDWMENLHDWCISRQIWFGHRIPVWYRVQSPKSKVQSPDDKILKDIHVGDEPVGDGWVQDSDTLDTWFSSGMWTFSTFGWPDNFVDGKKIGDLAKFHPTQMLETGYEIITLWVSRMIMMSLFAVNEIPFEKVYLHGMILDEKGKKMSKSKGNGIDPLDMIEKFGTDAVRLSLLIGNTPGNDAKLGEAKIESFRNFTNKLWNIARFILEKTEPRRMTGVDTSIEASIDVSKLTFADKWILSELDHTVRQVTEYLNNHEFSLAGELLREFSWNSLADWYLEISKFETDGQKEAVLTTVLTTVLTMWHPFMPFVTETIWQEMGHKSLLMVEKWPKRNEEFEHFDEEVHVINKTIEIIQAIRNARSENKVEPNKKLKCVIYAKDDHEELKRQEVLIKSLRTGINDLGIYKEGSVYENEIKTGVGGVVIYIIGAIDPKKEADRRKKDMENLKRLITSINNKLSNEEFINKAPDNVVVAEREKLEKYKQELQKYYI